MLLTLFPSAQASTNTEAIAASVVIIFVLAMIISVVVIVLILVYIKRTSKLTNLSGAQLEYELGKSRYRPMNWVHGDKMKKRKTTINKTNIPKHYITHAKMKVITTLHA